MDLLKVASLALTAAIATSCDPLIDESYRGEPVFSFEGQLVQFDDVAEQGYEFRTTLLWLRDPSPDPATQGPRFASAVEQSAAAVDLRFPSEFRLDIFAAPDDAMLVPGTGVGVALVVIYEDRDRNGRLTLDARPSELVGGASYEALVYARDPAAAAAAPFEDTIQAGFQLVRVPLFCSDGTDLPACDGAFGAACSDDSACGEGGKCFREHDGVVWPDGACLYTGNLTTCLPPDDAGVYFDEAGDLYFIPGCLADDECRDGYRCDDLIYYGCVPEALPDPDVERALPRPRRADKPPCNVPIGTACVVDGDCGSGGTCLVRAAGELFPNGYCSMTISQTTPLACEPQSAVPLAWDFNEEGRDTHWFRACAAPSDCRQDEGYECDEYLAACVPISPVALELQPEFKPPAVCYGQFGNSTR